MSAYHHFPTYFQPLSFRVVKADLDVKILTAKLLINEDLLHR